MPRGTRSKTAPDKVDPPGDAPITVKAKKTMLTLEKMQKKPQKSRRKMLRFEASSLWLMTRLIGSSKPILLLLSCPRTLLEPRSAKLPTRRTLSQSGTQIRALRSPPGTFLRQRAAREILRITRCLTRFSS